MSQNPNPNDANNPYNLHSTWNPFTQSYNPQSYNPQNYNPQNYNPQTPQSSSDNPYHQTSNPPPQTPSTQIPQITPESYQEFLLWKQSQEQAPLEHSVEGETPTPSRPKKSKAKAVDSPKKKKTYPVHNFWTSKEELLLAQTWIAISEDSNRGIDIERDSFWYLCMDEYNKRADIEKVVHRGKDALSSKWTYLNGRCQKFQGIWCRLSRERHSGEKDEDFRLRCLETFKYEANSNFHHEPAWNFLKDKQKWLVPDSVVVGRRNKRRDTDLGDDEEDEVTPNAALFGDDVHPRPPGKSRRAKSSKTSSDTSTKSSTPSFDESITQNFVQLTQTKATVYRTRDLMEAMRVLKMTTDGLSESDAWFLNMEKEKIRERLGWKKAGESGSGSGGMSGSGGGSASEDVDGLDSDED